LVTLAESNGVNGVYTLVRRNPLLYTNTGSSQGFVIVNSDDRAGDGLSWIITNNTTQIYAFPLTTPIVNPLEAAAVALPALSFQSALITAYMTNQPAETYYGMSANTNNHDVWVDDRAGSDYVFKVGSPDWPTKTVNAAINATAGIRNTIHVRAGTYVNDAAFTLDSKTLIGEGRETTILSNGITMIGTNARVLNLTCGVIHLSSIGPNPGPVTTNWYLENIKAVDGAAGDGIFLGASWRNGRAWGCEFGSAYDACADYSENVSNKVAYFDYCRFLTDQKMAGPNGHEVVVPGPGHMKFRYCQFYMDQNNTGNGAIVAPSITCQDSAHYATNGSTEFFSSSFYYQNGPGWAVSNGLNAVIKLHNCFGTNSLQGTVTLLNP
jgi:hypothetical protein